MKNWGSLYQFGFGQNIYPWRTCISTFTLLDFVPLVAEYVALNTHAVEGVPDTTLVVGLKDNPAGKFTTEYVNGRAGEFISTNTGSVNDIATHVVNHQNACG